jgi:hypothetical protein
MGSTAPQAAREKDKRLTFKRMPPASDGHGFRKVLEMGSVLRFPSITSITNGWRATSTWTRRLCASG